MTDDFDVDALLEASLKKVVEEKKRTQVESKTEEEPFRSKDGDYKVNKETDEALIEKSRSHQHSGRRDQVRSHDERKRDGDHHHRKHRRSRSGSRSPRRHRRNRSRSRSDSRDRSRHRSSRSPRRRGHSGRSRSPVFGRKRRSTSPELSDNAERDRRTIFVTQLSQRVRRRDLLEFFEKAGKVKDAKVVEDKRTGRSKGVGYVEFESVESMPKGLAMNGELLCGIPVIVQLTQAEKNRLAALAKSQQTVPDLPNRVYVGNLNPNITEEDLKALFEPFGEIALVNIVRDGSGTSKGYGFAEYKVPENVKKAIELMNGFELAGRSLRVGLVNEKEQSSVHTHDNIALDDGDLGGLALNAHTRALLMAKLNRDNAIQAPPMPAYIQQSMPVISRCLLLKNMFTPDEEDTPDWDQEIKLDVMEECSKYGQIHHIFVERYSQGYIFLKFDSIESAQKAAATLNGRWFSKKQIMVEFLPEAAYNARFTST